jgi:hypothetical protein
MGFKLDLDEAKQADRGNNSIRVSGKYIGTITRAEKLLSKNATEGVGFSFKTDSGETANYLDLYTVNSKGEKLPSNATVQAILCCAKVREVSDAKIKFEKWDKDAKAMVDTVADGYPELMGKRIGLLLQQELSTNSSTGADVDRVVIYGVFEPESEFTASEMIEKKTKPEKLEKMLQALMAKPIHDRREKSPVTNQTYSQSSSAFDDDLDAPF